MSEDLQAKVVDAAQQLVAHTVSYAEAVATEGGKGEGFVVR